MRDQTFFRTIGVRDGIIDDFTCGEPCATRSDHTRISMVDLEGRYSNSLLSWAAELDRLLVPERHLGH